MVIVIDLEEEEAKKNAAASAVAASKPASSDANNIKGKSETSPRTEGNKPASGQGETSSTKPDNQQTSKLQEPGNTSSGQEKPSKPAASEKVATPQKVASEKVATPQKVASEKVATPQKVAQSKPAASENVTTAPKASPAKPSAPVVTPESKKGIAPTAELPKSVASKGPDVTSPPKAATAAKASASEKVTAAKPKPSKSETVTSLPKTAPSKPSASKSAEKVAAPAKSASSKSSASQCAEKGTTAAKAATSESAEKVTPSPKEVSSKPSALEGAEKAATPSKPASEVSTPPQEAPAKPSASQGAEKASASKSSPSPGAGASSEKSGKSKRLKDKQPAKPTTGKPKAATRPKDQKKAKSETIKKTKHNEADKSRDKAVEKENVVSESRVKDENELEQDSPVGTVGTVASPATTSANGESNTETSTTATTVAEGQITKKSPVNSSSSADVKTYRQGDSTTSSLFSSSFNVPTVHSWARTVRDRLKQKGHDDSAFEQFGKCKSDEERVSLLYNMPVVHQVLEVKKCYQGKNETYSKDLRMQGNAAFQKKDFDKALELYSQSIIKAPCVGCPELALTLANRSAVFYHMQKYVLCLQDISQAFRYGYPDHLQYKLYERRGKASYCLRLKEEANCSFQDAINVLDRAQLDQQKLATIKSDLMKQLQKCSKLVPGVNVKTARDFSHNHGPIPEIKEARSDRVPCMAKSLVVKSVPERGRGLYATRDVDVGEVLIVEKPYASVTLTDHNHTHCHHCCNRTPHPLPCNQCSSVVFCSEECLDTAWSSYHYAECKYHDLIQRSEVGLGHLALRMVLKAGRRYLNEFRKTEDVKPSDPALVGCNANGIYDSGDYNSVYNLVAHTEDRSSSDLFKRTLTAVFLLKCIENSSYFNAVDGDEDFDIDEEKVFVGGHILRLIQMLPCNAHEVSELTFKTYRVEMSEAVEVGSAIYSTLSLINHSCDPSVVRHSYGNECVVRAIRNISAGEEVFDNYGVLYPVMSKAMRREKLSFQYYFNCDCHACARNWPMYNKIRKEEPTLYCKKCRVGRVGIPGDNRTTRAICADCREVTDITPGLLQLSQSEEFFQGALQKVLNGEDMDVSLPLLERHLRLIDRMLFRPWKDYNDCQEAIKQCYGAMANCHVVTEPDADDEELMESEHRRR